MQNDTRGYRNATHPVDGFGSDQTRSRTRITQALVQGRSTGTSGSPAAQGRFSASFQLSLTPNQHRSRPVLKRNEEWRQWGELSVKVMRLPRTTTTLELYRRFSQEGPISRIEIRDQPSFADALAYITFCPPPASPFWVSNSVRMHSDIPGSTTLLKIELVPKKRSFLHPSPVNAKQYYPERTVLYADSLDFGIMYDEAIMMKKITAEPKKFKTIQFMLDLLRREIDIQFPLTVPGREQKGRSQLEMYRFRLPLAHLERLYELQNGPDKRVLIIPMKTPPAFFHKVRDVESTHDDKSTTWTEWRTWFRTTEIAEQKDGEALLPVRLRKDNAIVDIGRWITYRLVFDASKNDKTKYDILRRALRDYNITIVDDQGIKILERQNPSVWNLIDVPEESSTALSALANFDIPHLSYAVRYQLEVCLSQGLLNEHNLSREFVEHLAAMDTQIAKDILEKVADMQRRFFDPMEIFDIKILRTSADKTIPNYCAHIRSATITPSTIYYITPTVEISNRIIRQFNKHEDRFLRVKFTDEKTEGRISQVDDNSNDDVFHRIKDAMINGISLGDRHYDFLAFGNSQFREHGAYFFASTGVLDPEQNDFGFTGRLTAQDIRTWMAELGHINEVGKWAARLGQSFSTTRAINGTTVKVVTAEDIERNGYKFTDGVGKISLFLAQTVALEFSLPNATEDPPSLFQFRLGGCKGVLAVDPKLPAREIRIRLSQYKFSAVHEGLEIVRFSSFATAKLNRQIILVLSTLGVKDQVFRGKLQNALAQLTRAMTDEKVALQELQRNIDFNRMTLTVARMILDGFMNATDPFTMSILQLWRAWSTKNLKEKAQIVIDQGAFLLGCVDETGTLNGHYEALQPSAGATKEEWERSLPEIFLRVDHPDKEKKGTYVVVEGICILARNPSLHPGDVRIVRAVDVPALHHLKNVVVLPQTGDRDLANMCSGGDLDGDDYLVMWDKQLLPEEWNHPAMDYQPPEKLTVAHTITVEDIIDFFVTYIKNDRLGRIAHAHLAQADYSAWGVKDDKCLELAELHSRAVDYPKSGVEAKMDRHLHPRKWPHFMEKKHKTADQIYHSDKVLGQLYDMVERVNFVPKYELPFDNRILDAYELDESLLKQAIDIKEHYDAAVRRVMAQHSISTEFEVWSTFVLEHNREKGDYKFHEEIGGLAASIKDRFRKICCDEVGGTDFDKLGPFIAAMYTVTAREVTAAVAECHETKIVGGREVPRRKMDPKHMPLMSFPWIFASELGKIASGKTASRGESIVAQQGVQKRPYAKKPAASSLQSGQDNIETAEGVTRRGDLLILFDDVPETAAEDRNMTSDSDHAAMVERGIEGTLPDEQRRFPPLVEPMATHQDWAPQAEVLEMLEAVEPSDEDEDGVSGVEADESVETYILERTDAGEPVEDDLLDVADTGGISMAALFKRVNNVEEQEECEEENEDGEEEVQIEIDDKLSALEALVELAG